MYHTKNIYPSNSECYTLVTDHQFVTGEASDQIPRQAGGPSFRIVVGAITGRHGEGLGGDWRHIKTTY